MTLQEAVSTCLSKYADFSVRASRAEYWKFSLESFQPGDRALKDYLTASRPIVTEYVELDPWHDTSTGDISPQPAQTVRVRCDAEYRTAAGGGYGCGKLGACFPRPNVPATVACLRVQTGWSWDVFANATITRHTCSPLLLNRYRWPSNCRTERFAGLEQEMYRRAFRLSHMGRHLQHRSRRVLERENGRCSDLRPIRGRVHAGRSLRI